MGSTSEDINHHRRRLLRTAVMTAAAAQFGVTALADAHPRTGKIFFNGWLKSLSLRR